METLSEFGRTYGSSEPLVKVPTFVVKMLPVPMLPITPVSVLSCRLPLNNRLFAGL